MSEADQPPKVIGQLRFHQIKSNYFRVVHADGMWCSVSQNNVHLTFYNERAPLPTEVVSNVLENNTLGGEDYSKRVAKQDFVRELEVDVVLSRQVAVFLHDWLGDYLAGKTPVNPPPQIMPH